MYRLEKFKKGEVDTSDLITGRKRRRKDERGEEKKGMAILVTIRWYPSQVTSLQIS